MKKFLAGMIAVLLVMGMTASVSASEILNESSDGSVKLVEYSETSTQSPTMEIQFNVAESYKVSIPASITLTGSFERCEKDVTISADAKLGSGKTLNVVVSNSGWSNPQYYVNTETEEFTQATAFSKVTYNVNSENSQGVKYTLSNNSSSFFQAFTRTDKSGILIISTDTSASSSLKFTAEPTEDNGKLPGGLHGYTQTFKIWVEPSGS